VCCEYGKLKSLPSLQVASHSKQDFSRIYDRTNCLGCHQGTGAHGEQAVINDQNCNTCHVTLDGQNKLLGYIHSKAEKRQPGVLAAASIYQVILGLLMIGGFAFFIRRFSGKS